MRSSVRRIVLFAFTLLAVVPAGFAAAQSKPGVPRDDRCTEPCESPACECSRGTDAGRQPIKLTLLDPDAPKITVGPGQPYWLTVEIDYHGSQPLHILGGLERGRNSHPAADGDDSKEVSKSFETFTNTRVYDFDGRAPDRTGTYWYQVVATQTQGCCQMTARARLRVQVDVVAAEPPEHSRVPTRQDLGAVMQGLAAAGSGSAVLVPTTPPLRSDAGVARDDRAGSGTSTSMPMRSVEPPPAQGPALPVAVPGVMPVAPGGMPVGPGATPVASPSPTGTVVVGTGPESSGPGTIKTGPVDLDRRPPVLGPRPVGTIVIPDRPGPVVVVPGPGRPVGPVRPGVGIGAPGTPLLPQQ